MNGQTTLGLEEGRARRDLGMKRVNMATPFDPWKANAMRAIHGLVSYGAPFTADAIRDYAGDPPRPNALGAVVNQALRQGLVEWRGDMVQSGRPEAHGRHIKVLVPRRERGTA